MTTTSPPKARPGLPPATTAQLVLGGLLLVHLVVVEVAFHPACIEPDQQTAQVFAQGHVLSAPPCGSLTGQPRPSAAPVRMTVPRGEAYPRETRGLPRGPCTLA